MKKAGQPPRGIEVQSLAGKNQRGCKSAQKRQHDPHRTVMNERAAPEPLCTVQRTGSQLIEGGEHRGPENRKPVQYHPYPGGAARTPCTSTSRTLGPFRSRRNRSGNPLPEFGCCHMRSAHLDGSTSKGRCGNRISTRKKAISRKDGAMVNRKKR